MFTYVKKNKFDIVGNQECPGSSNKHAEQLELQWGGKLFYSLGTARRLGPIISVNKKIIMKQHKTKIVSLQLAFSGGREGEFRKRTF